MLTYHFYANGPEPDPENRGVELSDLNAAKREAVQMLNEMLRSAWDRWEDSRVVVTNDEGVILFTMEISDRPGPSMPRPQRH